MYTWSATNCLINRVLRVVEPGFSRNTAKTIFEKIDTWMFLSCDDYRCFDCCLFLQHYTLSTDSVPIVWQGILLKILLQSFELCCGRLYRVAGMERFRKRSCETDWSGAGEMLRRDRYQRICICVCVCFCFLGVSFQFRICYIVTVTCLVDTQLYIKESSQHNIQNIQITMYNRNIHSSR